MDDLLLKIDKIFSENKLLGNYDFSEHDFSLMLDNVGELCHDFLFYGVEFKENNYKLIFTTLVEISKRWKDSDNEDQVEEKSPFWEFIFKYLINEESVNHKLYKAFKEIISHLGTQQALPVVLIGKKYYSTLMMHSFAPKDSLFSFFELCYNIYKKDLDFGYTSDDKYICDRIASEMKTVLGGGYREDKKFSIGSGAYSIKIGLRSFSINEFLAIDFVKFIHDTLFHINKLFNRETIGNDTRLKQYIVEWWINKTDKEIIPDDSTRKIRVPTVSKQDIVVKYFRDDKVVFLDIPKIRLDDSNSEFWLDIYVEGENVCSREMRTKKGDLVVTTKEIKFDLDDLLKNNDTINIRVEIRENQEVIFDSERIKTTSLNREFLLFEVDKEIISHINKPTNYFVYSKNIDSLKSVPDYLTTYGNNLYNIYPKAGESITGITKQVVFVEKTKTEILGKTACLIGGLLDVEWHFDDISCVVYTNSVKLMIPQSTNLKATELRINKNTNILQDLNYERIENDCYQFGLKAIGLVPENYPTEISLYSYEKETTILTKETFIVLPNLDIRFNHPFYYGDVEHKLVVCNGDGDEVNELTWTNQDSDIKCQLNNGILLIKIPYLKWRISNKEWHNEPIKNKIWYKDYLANGDLLEIDSPNENEIIRVFCKIEGNEFDVNRNHNGMYEIGREIYANEGNCSIKVYIFYGLQRIYVFTISTKEHFVSKPLLYVDGKVLWNVEEAFIGDKNNEFFLIVKSEENNLRTSIFYKNSEIKNLKEDLCQFQVKIKDKNIFSTTKYFQQIYKGEILIGTPEKIRFKRKKIRLISANCFNSQSYEWVQFDPQYYIKKLEFIQEEDNIYYIGQLYAVYSNGEACMLDSMINEDGVYDNTNPVRIELRDNSTLWLAAGWEGEGEGVYIGNLFCDKWRKRICNIQKPEDRFDEIKLYKFKVENDV